MFPRMYSIRVPLCLKIVPALYVLAHIGTYCAHLTDGT